VTQQPLLSFERPKRLNVDVSVVNLEKSPLRERIATTVVTLQSKVDNSPRSFRVTSLATEHCEVKVVDTTELFGDRANTGCICEGRESAVTAIT